MALQPGDLFPDLALESVEGPVSLSERWAGGTLIVAFMRHFGCAFCREHLIHLGSRYEEIQASGGDVVAIFQYRAESTRNFCRLREVPFQCLGDPTRDGYSRVELGIGARKEYFRAKFLGGWLKAARSGALPGSPFGGEVGQRPGTFVVAPDGRIVYAHYNSDATDNAPVEELVAAIRDAPSAVSSS